MLKKCSTSCGAHHTFASTALTKPAKKSVGSGEGIVRFPIMAMLTVTTDRRRWQRDDDDDEKSRSNRRRHQQKIKKKANGRKENLFGHFHLCNNELCAQTTIFNEVFVHCRPFTWFSPLPFCVLPYCSQTYKYRWSQPVSRPHCLKFVWLTDCQRMCMRVLISPAAVVVVVSKWILYRYRYHIFVCAF